jgi:drug/metabolite transporter superfamily protein YnfA
VNQKHKDEIRKIAIELIGGIILFLYGIIPTLQPSHFGRTNAAYGGIFIISSIIRGKFEVICFCRAFTVVDKYIAW